tara:strand:- start:2465 stop:3901 length:1437 start_codon:yes stop_codon:yes gene_type:complete
MKIKIDNISKSFGGVYANKNIDLEINSGIHALLGENGAGKSTLVKIISGQLTPDHGNILINDIAIKLGSPKESIRNEIGLLNQDPLDFANLSLLESFLVGINENSPYRNLNAIKKNISSLLEKYNVNLKLDAKIRSLSIGERQQLELLRLLYNGAKLIILDEPTSAFSLEQKENMFDTLRQLSDSGIIIIFVSHKLDEVFEICDSASILKSGEIVKNLVKPFDSSQILSLMFDRNDRMSDNFEYEQRNEKFFIKFSDHELSSQVDINNLHNFFQGSVIGFAGLQGSANDRFLRNFFTQENSSSFVGIDSNKLLMKKSFYYMPADRLERGLFPDMNLLEHFALSESSKNNFLDWKTVKNTVSSKINEFNIKSKSDSKMHELSGGNQQRVMLSLMPVEKSILLLEQPTRGLDVNSANHVWEMILSRKNEDIAVLFSSTDIDEIWEYSDIVISVHGESIIDISEKKQINKELIARYVSGIV